jgi:hypothetical protein
MPVNFRNLRRLFRSSRNCPKFDHVNFFYPIFRACIFIPYSEAIQMITFVRPRNCSLGFALKTIEKSTSLMRTSFLFYGMDAVERGKKHSRVGSNTMYSSFELLEN